MQIAKMFASLGFNVDMSGLQKFAEGLREVRGDTALLARNAKVLQENLNGVSKSLKDVNSHLGIKKTDSKLSTVYVELKDAVEKAHGTLEKLVTSESKITKSLDNITGSVDKGAISWKNYADQVERVKKDLTETKGKIGELRKNASVSIRKSSRTSYVGGENYRSNRPFDLSGGGFFRSMLPAVAIAGGLPTLGFAAKEVVQQGREQTKMESTLLATSKNTEEFGDTLKFVREEALRLGLSSVELGKSFAQVNMSADKLSQQEKKDMFTGMSEFMMSMGTNKDDQKGIFRAINQMFSNTRILQEEINQLSERGIPATLVWNAAKKAYGIEDITEIKKLQEKGKLDPTKVLPEMARMLQEMARSSGAYDKMMQSSIVKQGQFMEKLSQLSKRFMDSGVDVMLGKIFQQLSNIVDTLDEIGTGLSAIKRGLDEVTGGNSMLTIALTVLSVLLLKNRKGALELVKSLFSFSKVSRGIASFLNGRFGQVLVNLIKRWGLLGLAITAVIAIAKKVGEAFKMREQGQWTWLDTLILKFKVLQINLKTFMYDMRILFSNSKAWLNPFLTLGDYEIYKTIGQAKKLSNQAIPSRSAAGSERDVELTKKREEQSKNLNKMFNETKAPAIPYKGAGFNDWKVPQINNDITVAINGITVPDNQVSIMGNVR